MEAYNLSLDNIKKYFKKIQKEQTKIKKLCFDKKLSLSKFEQTDSTTILLTTDFMEDDENNLPKHAEYKFDICGFNISDVELLNNSNLSDKILKKINSNDNYLYYEDLLYDNNCEYVNIIKKENLYCFEINYVYGGQGNINYYYLTREEILKFLQLVLTLDMEKK